MWKVPLHNLQLLIFLSLEVIFCFFVEILFCEKASLINKKQNSKHNNNQIHYFPITVLKRLLFWFGTALPEQESKPKHSSQSCLTGVWMCSELECVTLWDISATSIFMCLWMGKCRLVISALSGHRWQKAAQEIQSIYHNQSSIIYESLILQGSHVNN